jgi:hypothetical protein
MTMDLYSHLFATVWPVFAVIGLGAAAGRWRPLSIAPLIDFVVYIAQPALVIHVLTRHPMPGEGLAQTALAAVFVVTFVGLLSGGWSLLSRNVGRDVLVCAMFANVANLPLPLAEYAFGPEGLSYQVVYMAVSAMLLYSVGVAIAAGGGWQHGLKTLLRMPMVYAAGLGFALSMTGATLPTFASRPVELLGNTAIPLLLFCLGHSMSTLGAKSLWSAFPSAALRILGGLAGGLVYVAIVAPSQPVVRAVLLGSAMPCAVQTYMLCSKFSANPERAAAAVFLSTALAFLYIPILVWFLL